MYTRAKGRSYKDMTLKEMFTSLLNNNMITIHDVINNNQEGFGYLDYTGEISPYNVCRTLELEDDYIEDTRYYTREQCSMIDFDNLLTKRHTTFFFTSYDGDIENIDDIDEDDIYSSTTLFNYIDNVEGFDKLSISLWRDGACHIHIIQRNFSNVYVRDLDTNHRFDGYSWCHGLAAYNDKDIEDSAYGIKVHPEWEICCSHTDQPIGPVGLYIKGDCKVVSNIDLYSEVDALGRYFNSDSFRAIQGIIESPSDFDHNAWDHSEAIVCNTVVTGIWYKEWYDDHYTIEALEDMFGMTAVKVKSRKE